MVGLGVAQAATYSDMAVDVSALPKEKRFIRELVLSRVWARTPPSAGGRVSSATEVDAQERVPPKRRSASLPYSGTLTFQTSQTFQTYESGRFMKYEIFNWIRCGLMKTANDYG